MTGLLFSLLLLACSLGKKTRDRPDTSRAVRHRGEKAQKSPLTQMTYESMREKRQLIVLAKNRSYLVMRVDKTPLPFR